MMNLGLKVSITFIIGLGWIGLFNYGFGTVGVIVLLAAVFMGGSVAVLAAMWHDSSLD